jgi:uncharacterized protein
MIKAQLEQDIKAAMLAKEADKVTTLRGLKANILNAEVAAGVRDAGLDDSAIITLFQKEAKKRQDSADLYVQGGAQDKADAELAEKAIIDTYLPAQLSDAEVTSVVESVIAAVQPTGMQDMGKVIAGVKQKTAGQADGALIAKLVKEKLA